jgi:SAM-dependent methyltransferase
MSRPAAATSGLTPLDEATLAGLLTTAVSARSGPVRLVGARPHDLAVRLIADGVPVEVIVPGRRDARAFRRALRRAGLTAAAPIVADLRIDLPVADAALDAFVCRLDPRTFPFPRHTVRELGRAVASGGVVVLLAGDDVPWPAGLVDAWAASAGLVPQVHRSMGGALPFSGAVYESRA